MNAYSLDLRKLVVAYVEEGHLQAEAMRQFKLHLETVSKWIKLKKTTGSLKAIAVPKRSHKLPLDALEEYVKTSRRIFKRNSIAFWMRKRRRGESFKKVRICSKKNRKFTENRMNRKGKYLLTK